MMLENQQLNFANHIKIRQKDSISSVQISEDEKFLAIGSTGKIQIFLLMNKKLIKKIKLDYWETISKFSRDSMILLSGDSNGYLHGYEIMNNSKLIYKDKVNSRGINDMITLDDEQILTCSLYSISITNFKQKQQLFNIQCDDQFIYAVDYDKSRDWIVYSEYDKINFISRYDSKIQITCSFAGQGLILQIQLLSKTSYLVSSCIWNLFLWQIDYENLRLMKIKEFNQHHVNFSSIFINYLVVICLDYVYIIDNDLVQIQTIDHNIQIFGRFDSNEINDLPYFRTRQLNSLKYILIPAIDKLQVLMRR